MLQNFVYVAFGIAGLGILASLFIYLYILRRSGGNEKMVKISNDIKKGSMAFVRKEYAYLGIFVLLIAVPLFFFVSLGMTVSFLIGTAFAVLVSFLSIKIAGVLNPRVAQAIHKDGKSGALKLAYLGGALIGLLSASLGIIALCGLYYALVRNNPFDFYNTAGFALGTILVAVLMRIGGGIFTKAADIGSDVVGKLENGFDDDDSKNPASIANLVGDSVGDLNGMTTDLFSSYVSAPIVLTIIGLAGVIYAGYRLEMIVLPIVLVSLGLISSLVGLLVVLLYKKIKNTKAFDNANYISLLVFLVVSYILIAVYFSNVSAPINIFIPVLLGVVSGILINLSTDYFASKKPIGIVAKATTGNGPSGGIMTGLSVGLESVIYPVIILVVVLWASYYFLGIYGVVLSALGLLVNIGMSMADGLFGPIVDSAGGVVKMAGLSEKDIDVAESLDFSGNTTSAIGKNIAISASLLVSVALFEAFIQLSGVEFLNTRNTSLIGGALVGGLLVFFLSGTTIKAVSVSAKAISAEVRRQLLAIKDDKKEEVSFKRCVVIASNCALQRMLLPIIVIVLVPVLVAMVLGADILSGLVMGAMVIGAPLAFFMVMSGSIWDNTKKSLEINKKTKEAIDASLVGDTVGDPLKDVAGPSLGVLVKLLAVIALVLALVI